MIILIWKKGQQLVRVKSSPTRLFFKDSKAVAGRYINQTLRRNPEATLGQIISQSHGFPKNMLQGHHPLFKQKLLSF